MIAHEIRAPLATIRAAAGLLSEHHEQLPAARRTELLDVVSDATVQINRVVEDLMVISRLNEGELPIELQDVDLVKIVNDTVKALNSRHPDRSIAIAAQDAVPPVRADAIRTRQIVSNLVANAIGYSRDSTEIIVSLVVEGDSVRTSVYNEGRGISASEQEKLFEPFVTLSERTPDSTGLGLFIAKGLVVAMDGSIGFTSQPGENAIFWFTLPTAPVNQPRSHAKAAVPV